MIDTVDRTDVVTIGSGKKLLIVNSGPGFTHHYIKPPLEYLAPDYELHFYDQPGCGQHMTPDANPTLQTSAQHLNSLIRNISEHEPITVLAHSWGGALFMAAVALGNIADRIEKVLLVATMPWTRELYEKVRQQFIERIPIEALEQFGQALTENRPGAELMNFILPYYSPEPVPLTGEIFHFNSDTYGKVNESLDDFDYRSAFNSLEDVHIILGEKDFITEDLFMSLMNNRTRLTVMKDVGHVPFYEKPKEFQEILGL